MAEPKPTHPGRSRRKRRPEVADAPIVAKSVNAPVVAVAEPADPRLPMAVGAVALALGVYWYWPAISLFVDAWNREPDYSHGYLVVPLAVFLLWLRGGGPVWLTKFIERLPRVGWMSLWRSAWLGMASWRRELFPGWGPPSLWIGGALLALAVVMRVASALFFVETLDAWSLVVWLAGVTGLLFGRRVLWWSLPAIGFLFFMIPLPFGAEQTLSYQLQGVATKVSCWSLQIMGQPALAEGHTILLGEHRLEVAQACSGLRLFVSILAVAYFYLVVVRCSWWERTVLVAAALPIAIFTNAMRIVVTGLLYQFVSGEAAHKFAHDMAGFVMIPVAAAIFGLLLWYLTMLFPWEEEMDVSSVVQQASL